MDMKKTPYPIVGMFRAEDIDHEILYYYSEDLLKDNIVIKEDHVFNKEGKVDTMLTVLHINKKDAFSIGVYWGPLLAGIQIHGILTTISNLHKGLSLDKFLIALHDLSVHSSSAGMQSDKAHADRMNADIFEEINRIQLLR